MLFRSTVPAGAESARRVAQLAIELGITVVYVGLPVSLAHRTTASTQAAVAFATELAATAPDMDVRLVDERLSTTTAAQHLRTAGRSPRGSKSVIDQAAAMVILDHALEMERARGALAGVAVGEYQ